MILMLRCVILVAVVAGVGRSQDIAHELPFVTADIRTPPVAPQTEGGYLLQYELSVTNWYDDTDITIRGVDIMAGDALLGTVEGETLNRAFTSGTTAVLAPHQTSIMVLSGVANELPEKLDHRIRFRVPGESEDIVVRYRGTPIQKNILRLRPPVRGDSWVAIDGPGSKNHHTGGVLMFEGHMFVPQRFAIDFNRRYEDGEVVHGNPEDVHNYRCYGAEVFAVADGHVVAVRNDVPDNPGKSRTNALPDTLANLGGNRVVLDLGGGRFAGYYHLKPGSIRVKAGDTVHAGDVLALVGNSGAPAPHLHFQVMDSSVPWTSDGLPYVFDSFVRNGKRVTDQMPMDGWVLTFERSGEKQ
jgi:murein DD-endopeptidase MepM/ murein hydrolase activator NlpD